MNGKLLLESGEVFSGNLFVGNGIGMGKMIFDTRVVGYEKVLTSPEYYGKIVCFTYPLIGTYGVCLDDIETDEIFPSAVIISEYSTTYSNFNANSSLKDFLKSKKVSVIEGIDTQNLTALIRNKPRLLLGAVAPADAKNEEILKKLQIEVDSPPGRKKKKLGLKKPSKPYIAVLNRPKKSEIAILKSEGFLTVECSFENEKIISESEGIYIAAETENLQTIKNASEHIKSFIGEKPVFATGAGHLALGIALGGQISQKPVNHYGINQPVKDLKKNLFFITEQSHSLVIDSNSLWKKTRYFNINDDTIEGIEDSELKIFSTAFIPQKANLLDFFSLIKSGRK